MRQQVLRSGPNGENISVGRIEIEKGSRVLWKRKRGQGYSKSVVLVDVIVESVVLGPEDRELGHGD